MKDGGTTADVPMRGSYSTHLRELRKMSGKSQAIVAAEVGVAKSTYSSWETGRNELGSSRVIALCQSLGCTANDIFGFAGNGDVRFSVVEDATLDPEIMEHMRLYRRSDPAVRQGINTILAATAKVRPPRTKS